MSTYTVEIVDWHEYQSDLLKVRRVVFIDEQDVPEEEELDINDPGYIHALARDPKLQPIATGRLLPDGKVGRMAVLKAWRGMGVGSAVLHALTCAAGEAGIAEIILDAQIHAISFYQKQGYQPFGEEFMDAGIPHIKMRRNIS